jgi:hypothetical protein
MTEYQNLKDKQAQPCRLRYMDGESGDEAEMDAVLLDVGECRVRNGYEQFALLFRVADGGVSRQGIYAVSLPALATQEWFLVPVGRDDEGTLYDATFNRLVSAAS